MQVALDNSNEALASIRAPQVEKDIKALWSEAKSNTRLEMFEYTDAQASGKFKNAAVLDALPTPVSSVERGGENKLDNPAMARKFNKTYLVKYLELLEEQYPTPGSVRRAKRTKDENGNIEFEVWQKKAQSEARSYAVEQHIEE